MSELTECNYCKFEAIKKEAKVAGMSVLRVYDDAYKESCTVYVLPMDVNFLELTDEQKEEYFKGWFMELPSFCAC